MTRENPNLATRAGGDACFGSGSNTGVRRLYGSRWSSDGLFWAKDHGAIAEVTDDTSNAAAFTKSILGELDGQGTEGTVPPGDSAQIYRAVGQVTIAGCESLTNCCVVERHPAVAV